MQLLLSTRLFFSPQALDHITCSPTLTGVYARTYTPSVVASACKKDAYLGARGEIAVNARLKRGRYEIGRRRTCVSGPTTTTRNQRRCMPPTGRPYSLPLDPLKRLTPLRRVSALTGGQGVGVLLVRLWSHPTLVRQDGCSPYLMRQVPHERPFEAS